MHCPVCKQMWDSQSFGRGGVTSPTKDTYVCPAGHVWEVDCLLPQEAYDRLIAAPGIPDGLRESFRKFIPNATLEQRTRIIKPMDPTACYATILELMARLQQLNLVVDAQLEADDDADTPEMAEAMNLSEELFDHVQDLIAWLEKGGFMPTQMMTGGMNKDSGLFMLTAVLDWLC